MSLKPQTSFLFACALASLLTFATSVEAQVIINDSWADGSRTDGAEESDTNWWTSTSMKDAIEVKEGSLGLVSGSSGRGIRATFAAQTLEVGDSIVVTYKFTTPATIGKDVTSGLRVGIFDKLERGGLESDLKASSGSPNALYDGLPGYMADLDCNLGEGKQDINIRKHNLTASVGRLLGTNAGFDTLGKGGDDYEFATAATEYTGVLSVKRTGKDSAEVSSSLSQGEKMLTSHTETDDSSIANNFGMIAFHATSNAFGTSKTADEEDNGIDFSNVTIELKKTAKSDK